MYTGLHGLVFHKIVPLIVITVITPNPNIPGHLLAVEVITRGFSE
jgi:hypothetical protein